MLQLKLVPLAETKDQILVYDESGYPSGMLHIDTFYTQGAGEDKDSIYNHLRCGQNVIAELHIKSK